MTIDQVQKLNDKIRSFNECYTDCKLWGSSPDGDVKPEQMLEWLIYNNYMVEIALGINKQCISMGITL